MRKPNDIERELLIQHGSPLSEAMFDYPCNFFYISNCIGYIAYRIEHQCAIIIGGPICPDNEISSLIQSFHDYCKEAKLNVIYIATSEKFVHLAKKHYSISIEVCEEIFYDPEVDPTIKSHRLKQRKNQAAKRGLTFHEYIPSNKDNKTNKGNQEIENTLLDVGIKWQQALKGPSLHLGHLNFFESTIGKRWFYVEENGRITSMAMLSKLEAYGGWLLKFLVTLPTAIVGTSEFLMISLLSQLRQENCRFLTKGVVPKNVLGEVKGLGHYTKFVRYFYKLINLIFKFEKRKEYWLRYCPKSVPSYLLFANPKIGFNEVRALLKAFKLN